MHPTPAPAWKAGSAPLGLERGLAPALGLGQPMRLGSALPPRLALASAQAALLA